MRITFVKKIFADGTACKKCREVNDRMQVEGVLDYIDHIAIADERDLTSEGMVLAQKHQAQRAPFFLVEEAGATLVFDVYFKFKKFLVEKGLEVNSANQL